MAATKLYAFWELSGNPPSPWYKVLTYNDRFPRSTSNTSSALGTGGNNTHLHSLNSGHTISTTNDLTNIAFTPGTSVLQSYGVGHNHSIGTVAIAAASNNPSYYTLSLIAIDLYEFVNSQRKLPKGAVVASTASISDAGFSRISSADGKLIKLSDVPGSSYDNTTHVHSFTGSLSYYQSSAGQTIAAVAAILYGPIGDTHTHGVSSLSTTSESIMPSRIQTRLYGITADPYTSSVPINTVLFVDGSITGYTNYFETIATWNDRFIESADSDPTQIGSDIHNHGSSTSGASDISDKSWGSGKIYGSSRAISRNHTHDLVIYIDSTDVDHKPPYVYLAAVRVKASILSQQTKTKTYSMKTILQKKDSPRSYGMDIRLFRPGSKYYNMGIFMQKGGLTKTINMDIKLLLQGFKSYDTDIVLKRNDMSISYRMDMAPLFLKGRKYEMGIRLVNIAAIPRYSVINTLQDSYIGQYNKFLQTVEASKVSLKIESAAGYDLERRWGRAFDLPRDPGETDTQYRSRLMSYMSSVVGCGTKSAIKAALNVATGGQKARVDSYPGLIRVNFDSDFQRRAAFERRTTIEKILNFSVAAGIQWILYLPFKDYRMNILLRKERLDKNYNIDMLLERKGISISYAMDLIICSVRDKSYTMDTLLEKTCSKNYSMFMGLKRIGLNPYEMDTRLLKKSITVSHIMDLRLMKICSKIYYMKMILEKFNIEKKYVMDMRLTKTDYKLYKMAMILKKKFNVSYSMDLLLALSRKKSYVMDIFLVNRIHKIYTTDLLVKKLGDDAKESIAAKIVEGASQSSLATSLGGKIWIKPQEDIVLPEMVYGSYKDVNGLNQYFSADIPANTKAYSSIKANLCNYISVGTLPFIIYQGEIEGETLATEITDVDYTGLNGLTNYDVLIRDGLISDYTMDILLANERTMTIDVNIMLNKSVTKSYYVDILLKKVFFTDYNMGMRLKTVRSKSYLMDLYLMKKARIKTYTIDLMLKKACLKIYFMGILTKKARTKTYTIDLMLKKACLKIYFMGILTKKARTKTYTMDLMLKKVYPKIYFIDILIKKARTKTYTTDLLVKKLGDDAKESIAAKIVEGASQSSLATSLGGKIWIKPQEDIVLPEMVYGSYKDVNGLNQYFSADIPANTKAYSSIKANLCNYISVGTLPFIIYQGEIEGETLATEITDVDYTGLNGLTNYDVLIRDGLISDYTMDILIGSELFKVYTMDLQLRKAILKTYQVDTLLQGQRIKSLFMDIFLAKRINKSYAMDIYLKNVNFKSCTMDLQLRKTVLKIYAVDLLIRKKEILKTYNMSLKIRTLWNRKIYVMDIFLMKRISRSYVMDIYLMQKDRIRAYTMSLVVQKEHVKYFSMDTLIEERKITPYGMGIILEAAAP